LKYKLIFVL